MPIRSPSGYPDSVRQTDGLEKTRVWARAGLWIVIGVALPAFSSGVHADGIPLHLTADEVFISAERDVVEATGAVNAELETLTLSADALDLRRTDTEAWALVATGGVHLEFEDSLTLSGDRLAAIIDVGDNGARPVSLEAEGFGGQSRFVNSVGDEHTLYFLGGTGSVIFTEDGEVRLVEVRDVEFTTCDCCGVPLRSQPYTLRASRLQLYPDQLIVVFGLTARVAGVPSFWLPVYAQPLGDTLESPLFPAFGRSALRGWFLKWNIPYYISESLYGSVLFDYYSAYDELGTGIIARYAFLGHEGRLRVYRFPAKVGDSIFEFSARHSLPPGAVWRGEGSAEYRIVGDTTELDFGAKAQGSSGGWTVTVSAEREIEEDPSGVADGASERTVTERVPEISVHREAWDAGFVSVRPSFAFGLYRETIGDLPTIEALRASAAVDLRSDPQTVAGVHFSPSLILEGTIYQGDGIDRQRGSLQGEILATWRDLAVDYDLVFVQGGSPFDFDTEVAAHHIGWTIVKRDWGTLTISGGISLEDRALDPLRAQLKWSNGADWDVSVDYSLSAATLDEIQLTGNLDHDLLRLTWSIPYLPQEAGFGAIDATADAQGEWLDLDVDASLDDGSLAVNTNLDATLAFDLVTVEADLELDNLSFAGLRLSAALTTPGGWGGRIEWSYVGGPISIADFRYGLFWDIGGCLRVGVDREATDTWFYVSILAFPDAIVRYAPATSRIETGN